MAENEGKAAKRDLTAGTYEGNTVPKKTAWIYSMSGIFRDACYALISGSFFNYAKTAGLIDKGSYSAQVGAIVIIYVLCLIWDGFNDPIMGLIIEKCHLKTGKFRPWILIGAIGNTIVLLLMFLTKPTGWAFVACFGIYYFLWDFVFTMNDIGYWSMLPSLSNDEKERTKLTTMVTVATTIGSTAMYVCTGLLVNSYNISTIYGYFAIPVAILFLLSQTAVFFFCKEHARDPKQDSVSDQIKFKDLFVMVKQNKPLRLVVIAIFFYYIIGAILTTMGYDYFYFIYGYGGSLGGSVATYFLAVYILGALIAQCFYTVIAKHFKQKQILFITFVGGMVSIAVFFILGVPLFGEHPLAYSAIVNGSVNIFNGTGWLILIPIFVLSACLGVFYLALLVMMQNTIDYNEYQFGERKESVAFSWRPFDAKLSAAVKWGFYLLALVASGTMAIYQTINDQTAQLAQNNTGVTDAATIAANQTAADNAVQNAIANASRSSIVAFDIWFFAGLFVCLAAAYLFIRCGYTFWEDEHMKVVKELEIRNKADMSPAPTSAPSEAK
jgi:Na+/melibiose symporter-like transporter